MNVPHCSRQMPIRVVGAHPRHPGLTYNLGGNGVGFLPSIYGGQRIAQLLADRALPASIFDPR
jgi:glycine/D-amino acid oxidase-like deaminating enzyme